MDAFMFAALKKVRASMWPANSRTDRPLTTMIHGKGVLMILGNTKQKPAMDDSQERPDNRKMATLAAVYSVDPYVRDCRTVS